VLIAIIGLILLIIVSGFFSSSETGMMAINRYRLQHEAQAGDKCAKQILHLLKRPDRLLGVILIGSTFSNIFASTLATIIAIKLYGEASAYIASFILTFIVLVFAEVAPKRSQPFIQRKPLQLCHFLYAGYYESLIHSYG